MSNHTALLVVDVQVGLIEKPVYAAAAVLERIAGLIGRAHAAGAPVVYVQDKDVGGVGSREWQIHPAVAPQAGDLVIRKAWSDSFHETELRAELEARGVDHLVIGGMQTEACVDTTCRRAVALGYGVTLAADAHTTVDNQILPAPKSIEYHNAHLEGFGQEDGFGEGKRWIEVKPSAEIAF
jgi:nicotinamidase-related amidase